MAITGIESLAKFGHVVPEIFMQRDRQTSRHARHNTPLPYKGGVITVGAGGIGNAAIRPFGLTHFSITAVTGLGLVRSLE